MSADRLRQLNERIAELFRDDWPISTRAEPPPGTSVDPPTIDEAVSEASVTEIACAAENAPTMTEQPRSVLDGLSLDTAIRLRWALRDIKPSERNCRLAARTGLSLTRLTFQITHATDSDTNVERDYIIAELMKNRVIEAVKVVQSGQRLPAERVNHYTTDGEVTLASLVVNDA